MVKLKAGALVYVIVLSLIIMSLLGLIIMRSYYLSVDVNLLGERDDIRDNINSVVNIIDEDSSLLPFGKEFDLFEGSIIKSFIRRDNWGLLDIVNISSSAFLYRDSVCMLSACSKAKEDSTALWITDKRNYITISGSAYLRGKCYIPRLGMRKGYVEKQSYYRKEVIHGKVLRSQPQLRMLSEHIQKRFYAAKENNGLDYIYEDDFDNSFQKVASVLYSAYEINLSGKSLKGKIKVISDKVIKIDSSSIIDNCLICAPIIIIGSGFKGRLQAFASEKIVIGEDVVLGYPSYLFLKSTDFKGEIYVGERAIIKGGVLMQGDQESLFKTEHNSIIEGQVYVYGKASLQGSIHGNAYIDKLIFNTKWSRYEDVIYNTLIDRHLLKEEMPVLNLFSQEKRQVLIEWLK
jgi:hypothetical protein